MNQINRQVTSAHRRMIADEFAQSLVRWQFVGLSLAALAIAVPKIWHLPFLPGDQEQQLWFFSWLAGGLVFGLIVALAWTYVRRGSRLSAAIEVDQRFALKERLSSALALSPAERDTPAGQALIQDASRRAESIDVRDQFQVQPVRQMLLPVLPAILLAALLYVPNAVARTTPQPTPEKQNVEIKVAVDDAREKIKKKIEEMEAKGLADAAANLKSLEKKIDNLSSNLQDDDKKQTLVELNNVKKQLAERQQQIGGDSQQMKKQLEQLNRVNDGPAKKLSESINEGDFKEASQAISEMLKNLKDGKLSEAEKRKLAEDLAGIANELKKMGERHEQAKQELKEAIQKANQEGDLEKAAKLQQKLEQLEQQDQQLQKMQKMAEKMQNCANCMKQGNGQPKQGQQGNQSADAQLQQAMKSLEEMEDLMQQLQDEMGELEDLEDIMKQIEAAKNECQGCEGNKEGAPNWKDWAKGEGRGGGKRDKQETETGTFKSRVKGKLQPGETVATGHADGNNITGKSISEARELARSSLSRRSDPLENQKLPRSQREHARQYFENLRGD